MAQLEPTYFVDDSVVTIRAAEVPAASFTTGMNNGGSNACGIGINMLAGAVVGTPEQFTLLDQRGLARAAQISQFIGGEPLGAGQSGFLPEDVIRYGVPSTTGDGAITPTNSATLTDLAVGWTAAAP